MRNYRETTPGNEDTRNQLIDLSPEEFRRLGYRLVDRLTDYLATIREEPAARACDPKTVRTALGQGGLPGDPAPPDRILEEACDLLFTYGRRNGHPRSFGYIVGSPAPLGILSDLLASGVNHNIAGWESSPAAAEIEVQCLRWVAELLGYPTDCGAVFTSGGNVANLIGFLVARRQAADRNVRSDGLAAGNGGKLIVYATAEAHTWLDKAADIAGLGTKALRRIATDSRQRMDLADLRRQIERDRAEGYRPSILVGTAGTTSTGAVDPLQDMATVARTEGLWFHVDGAYGAPAIVASNGPEDLQGLREADSLSIDAHKWLFAPLEAGIALVRDRNLHRNTFSFTPSYYAFSKNDEEVTHFYNDGPQNSRCFRALKVWSILRSLGRQRYVEIVDENIRLARRLFDLAVETPGLEALTQSLSITTFRVAPADRSPNDPYLDSLNRRTMELIQGGGEAHLSNAIVDGRFALRVCITNFRTRDSDMEAVPDIVLRAAARAAKDLGEV
jgi:glutamate/tyrosine decarboxylase-like PLP-dependent enzyme